MVLYPGYLPSKHAKPLCLPGTAVTAWWPAKDPPCQLMSEMSSDCSSPHSRQHLWPDLLLLIWLVISVDWFSWFD